MKINNLSELRAEKLSLQHEAGNISAAISSDIAEMKSAIQPGVLIHKAVLAIIPEALKNSKITGVPIDFILKAIFNHGAPATKPDPAEEKRNKIKNIAIGILESAAMVLLTKGLKTRI